MSTKPVAAQPGPARRARLSKSETTSARILDAALALFNAEGTAAVSTNRIAATAGLSPGNLYYHFADKQQIIRALFERYTAAQDRLWDIRLDASADLALLRAILARSLDLAWQYRFAERELIALLRAD